MRPPWELSIHFAGGGGGGGTLYGQKECVKYSDGGGGGWGEGRDVLGKTNKNKGQHCVAAILDNQWLLNTSSKTHAAFPQVLLFHNTHSPSHP